MKSRFTYANVAATLALVVSLSGTAVAAGVIVSKSNQLGKQVVTNAKIKKGTIKTNRLNAATVTELKGAKGDKGDAGSAKAYGEVSAAGVKSNDVGVTATSKVLVPDGIYCIDLAVTAKTLVASPIGAAAATSIGVAPGPLNGCPAGTDFTIIPLKDNLAINSGFYFAAN